METRLMISNPEISDPLVIARLSMDKFPRISRMANGQAIQQLIDIISKAYLYKGYRLDEQNIKFLASALYDEVILDQQKLGMKWLTMYEIGYAIKKAVMNDEEFFFSVSHLYKILRNYCKGEGHMAHLEAVKITKQIQENKNTALNAMIDSFAGKLLIQAKNR